MKLVANSVTKTTMWLPFLLLSSTVHEIREMLFPRINREYYTVARRCEFYVLVARTISQEWSSERVRYCSCHENIKFISSSHRVMFFSLCTYQCLAPMGGVRAYAGYWQENVAHVRGNLIFFYQGIPEGRDYWHPWSSWTGPVINLLSRAPKRGRKTNIEPRIKFNHNIYNRLDFRCFLLSRTAAGNRAYIYKQMKHITDLCLLKLKMIFKWKWSLFKFICLLQFPLPLI